jgi:hypothetical protein
VKSFGRKMGAQRLTEYERRRAGRTNVSLPGSLDTPATRRSVVLVDVSPTGANVRGQDLPSVGNFVKLDVETSTVFGTVIWCKGGNCGLQFDELLTRDEVKMFDRAHKEARDLELESWSDETQADVA